MKKTYLFALAPLAAALVLTGCGRQEVATPAADTPAAVTRQADMPRQAPAAAPSDVTVDTTVAPITKDTSVDDTLKDVDAAVKELEDM